jgi:CheY-like chemotaxis protein
MSNSVMIVEKDLALMSSIREALTGRGFEVQETTDGKGAPELIRRNKPNCVVLAVDLDAGQNGYIICKKLKSDDELKGVPVVIIGDPKGFAQHQKLKTRAEQYVGKPLDAGALVETIGGLIGFPAAPAAAEESGFDPGSLLEESDAPNLEAPAEEATGDADLALVDSMFDDKSAEVALDDIAVEAPAAPADEEFDAPERTVVGFLPVDPSAHKAAPAFQSSGSAIDNPDARELRAKVTELTGALDEARGRTEELEAKLRELESDLETKSTELEAARSAGGKSDNKEVFALRDAANKKDKEILKLKNEVNAKDQEVLELKEKENTLEQQLSEANDELAKRDAALKTAHAKADQLAGEKKKLDQQLAQAKEEGRAASAKLSTLEMDYQAAQERLGQLEGELESTRGSLTEAESAKQALETELAEAKGELEAARGQLDERTREAEEARAANEQAQADLDSTRAQLTSQATSFADEISGLRQRLADAEGQARAAEEKTGRAQARLRAILEQQERVRASLQNAVDTLAETPADGDDDDLIAEA